MQELTVKRWRRYGKDRLYVNLPDGGRVGWLDLQTGQRTLEREDLQAAFEDALRTHASDEAKDPTSAPAVSERPEAPAPPDPADGPMPSPSAPGAGTPQEPFAITIDWRDVGARQAGQAAQEQAHAHRRAAPVRTFAARVLGVHTDERAWRIGAAGERRVAARLERLPDPWTALHAIPVGDRGADIDHLVIGPGGVFTINAKHHPDARVWVGGNTVMVNGHRQPYVRNSRHEARRASRLLSVAVGTSVEVTGVIAIVGAHTGFTIKSQPVDVRVVARKGLVAFLTSLPTVLDEQQVDRIHRAARRSDTWCST
jgi:hypothetical protein